MLPFEDEKLRYDLKTKAQRDRSADRRAQREPGNDLAEEAQGNAGHAAHAKPQAYAQLGQHFNGQPQAVIKLELGVAQIGQVGFQAKAKGGAYGKGHIHRQEGGNEACDKRLPAKSALESGLYAAAAAEAAWLADLAAWLEGGKPARSFDFDESDDAVRAARKELGLLSAKPVIYACNVGEDDLLGGLDENPYFPLVAARAKEENAQAIPICAKTEEDIAGSTQEEKIAFLQEMGIESTGLDKLIKASYELLGLISFLTDGKKECRAWTIKRGTKAPQAAGKIHSDFERGFIRAQVIAYKDLEDADFNYAAVKAKGLQRTEGKEYVVNDGDVIEFLFNV